MTDDETLSGVRRHTFADGSTDSLGQLAMTENELLQAIVEGALFLGWRVHHDRRSDKALQQGTPGFPDLVLAKRGRVIFAELKSEKGRPSEDQVAWAQALTAASLSGHYDNFRLIRPSDLDAFLKELAR